MGIQGSNIGDVTGVTGASVLVIEQACENTQLLISLCRNDKEWLSPVGWTEKQKITLLDCRSHGGTTEIDIPSEFSKVLATGDKLVLKCSELDLTQEIIWEASNQRTRPAADLTPATSLAGGLLSRFKSIKTPEITDLKSEAQLRADEADLAAESYRAKMEAATAAKDDAHRRALNAAREAEAALKMEAERIADMERAAKAFEEAERLKQDGLRRVQEERRQEEARIAEEARRIEEARKREEAAKLEAERKAALERYETALDETLHQETRLENRLSRLKTDTAALEREKSEQVTLLSSLQDDWGDVQSRVGTARKAYEKTASKLEGLNSELLGLQSKSDNLSIESTEVSARVVAVESEYLTAQKEAEMAIASAEEKRNLLKAAREEKDAVHSRLNALSRDLETQATIVSETTVKTQKLQSKFETAQADLSNTSMNIESLESGAANLSDSIQTSRVEIEATQQAVEDCRARQTAHQAAIAHLEAGGSPENVPEFDLKTRFFAKEDSAYNDLSGDEIHSDDINPTGLFGRVRRNFSRSKEAEISIEVDDVVLDEVPDIDVSFDETDVDDDAYAAEAVSEPFTVEDIIAEPELKTAGFVRRHSKSLLVMGTILGGAAILGGGFLVNQANQPQGLTVKSSTPAAPTEQVKTPAIKTSAIPTSTVVPVIETPTVIPSELIPAKSLSAAKAAVTKLDIPDIPVPNLTMTGLSLDNVPAKTTAKSKLVTVKKAPIQTKKIQAKKIQAEKIKVVPKAVKPKNFPELTTRVQSQLRTLGLYAGSLNGLQTVETTAAITAFQAQYSLPKHGRISGNFLTALAKADIRHKQNQKSISIKESLPQNENTSFEAKTTQLVDVSFSAPVFYDTVKAVQSETVITDTLPTVETYNAPEITLSESVVVQHATAPIITAPPVAPAIESVPEISETVPSQVVPPVQDVVVEAQKTRPAKASYPKSAANKNYFVDVRIVVGYDIDPFGKVVNARILTNDHSGRFNSSFERAAMSAVKKQRFIAKTINGLPVASPGQKQRIVFKGE